MFLNFVYNLCTPAKLYFIISLILLAISSYYDITRNEKDKICLGKLSCKIENKPIFYILNILFILLWAFILNMLCRFGWSDISVSQGREPPSHPPLCRFGWVDISVS